LKSLGTQSSQSIVGIGGKDQRIAGFAAWRGRVALIIQVAGGNTIKTQDF